jgi:hypothetical protein
MCGIELKCLAYLPACIRAFPKEIKANITGYLIAHLTKSKVLMRDSESGA